MTLKERLKNPFVQQYILEIAFPLVGYLFFDWSIFIIAIYYLLDQFAIQTISSIRLYKIRQFTALNSKLGLFFGSIILFLIFFSLEIYLIYHTVIEATVADETTLNAEFVDFAKSELWLIAPMLILVYAFKDRFTFYMPRRYLKYSFKKSVNVEFLKLISIFVLTISLLFLWQKLLMNEVLVLLIFVLSKIGYDFTIHKIMNEKSLND